MLEDRIGLSCVSEPGAAVRVDPCWFYSHSRLAAVFWLPQLLSVSVILSYTARDFVTVKAGDMYITSVYVSPNQDNAYFLQFLDDFKNFYLSAGCPPMVLCGDFNARSQLWGDNKCNHRGEILEEWTAELDFRLCNLGNTFTCIRPQGSSIPDTTWTSPSCVDRISRWHVVTGMETFSDHVYIFST